MTAPFILAAYAFFVGALGHRVLRRCAWPERSPRLGILVWQALTASVVLSTVLAGIAMAFSSLPVGWSIDIAWWLHACAEVLREQYSTPGGVALGAAGGVLAAGVPARVGYCLTRTYWSARRSRANQRRALALVARRDETDGFLVVEHPAPLVYCMPGRDREVIFTTGALTSLDRPQVEAVLSHEESHLRGHHDRVMTAAKSLKLAFPFAAIFAVAYEEQHRLVEMHADDNALSRCGRRQLASALVQLAQAAAPAGTLAAGGETAIARVHRLAEPARPLGRAGSIIAAVAAVVVVGLPLAVAVAPAVAAVITEYCPVALPI